MFCYGDDGCTKIIALCKQCNQPTLICETHSSLHFIKTKHNNYETDENIITELIRESITTKIEHYTNEINKKEEAMINYIRELASHAINSLKNVGKSLSDLHYFERMNLNPDSLSGIVDDLEFIFQGMKTISAKSTKLINSEVKFEVHCPTNLGETVLLSGSCPELGSWNIEKAVRMKWIHDYIWVTRIKLRSKNVKFKYIIRTRYENRWEDGNNRSLSLDYSTTIDRFRFYVPKPEKKSEAEVKTKTEKKSEAEVKTKTEI